MTQECFAEQYLATSQLEAFELGQFQYFVNKTHATALQLVLVPWLMGYAGLWYKATPMSVVQEMITATIDSSCWFGHGVSCAEEAKRFLLAWSDLVKKAKNAAGIFHFFLFLKIPCF